MFNILINLIGPLLSKFIIPWFQNLDVKELAGKIGVNRFTGIAFSILLTLMVYFAIRSSDLEKTNGELMMSVQNVEAMADSVSYERNRAGELEAVRLALTTEVENLGTYSQELADELAKEKGKVSSLSRTVATISRDTVYLVNTVYVDSSSADVIKYEFSWSDAGTFGRSSRFIEGTTFVEMMDQAVKSSTAITKDYLQLYVVQGIRLNDDGKYESFIRSDYPGIEFDTRSAILDLQNKNVKAKKWGIGIGVGYDFINMGPQFGVGLQRNFIRF